MTIETIIEAPAWAETNLPEVAACAADATFRHLGYDPADWEISLLACDDARISLLNADFRGKPQATNVLSWPSEERGADLDGGTPFPPDDPELGDIAIAFETCLREASEQSKTFTDHVTHLVVHAVLHLLGYDHIRDGDATLMERLEREILGKLGIADPYCDENAL